MLKQAKYKTLHATRSCNLYYIKFMLCVICRILLRHNQNYKIKAILH